MKAAILHGKNDLKVQQIPDPKRKKDENLIQVSYCGICGSDLNRVVGGGAYFYPLIPGHEFSGTVEEPADNSSFKKGDRVAVYPLKPCFSCPSCQNKQFPQCENYDYYGSRCDGGFAQYVSVPDFNLIPVPDEVSMEEAALCEPASVAQHGLNVANLKQGESILVFGTGAIGLMLSAWSKIKSASKIVMVDIFQEKLDFAKNYIDAKFINSREENLEDRVELFFGDRGADLVVEGTGAPEVYLDCIRYAKRNGKILFLGNPSSDLSLPKELVSKILRKQLKIYGTWNSNIAEDNNEWQITLKAVADGKLNLKSTITHKFLLDEINKAFSLMHRGEEFYNRIIIKIKSDE